MAERYARGTCYHEAGHAVVAWSLDLQVKVVRVSDDDESGETKIDGTAHHLPLPEQIAALYAGYAAERVFKCSPNEREAMLRRACRDRKEIYELLKLHKISEEEQGKAHRDEGYNCACLRLATHKSRVIRLAERLIEYGSVDRVEFLQLMHDETPEAS